MLAPSSVRSRFSSNTLSENGRRCEPSTALSLKISYDADPTCKVPRLPKLSTRILQSHLYKQDKRTARAVPRRDGKRKGHLSRCGRESSPASLRRSHRRSPAASCSDHP